MTSTHTNSMLRAAALSLLLLPSTGIVIRADRSDADYLIDESAYPAVFPIDPSGRLKKGECAATLITAQYALTAAHCVLEGVPFPVEIAGAAYSIVEAHANPCFSARADGPNGHDIAVIRLDREVPDRVVPHGIYLAGDEVGKATTMLGWGDTGTSDGKPFTDRKFRRSENRVDWIDKGILYSTFSDDDRDLEGLSWLGDSGGPLFIDGLLAGVNSDGNCCGFGSVDEYKRVGDHFEWVKDVIREDPGAVRGELAGEFAGSPAWGFSEEIAWSYSYSYEADSAACLWEAEDYDDDDDGGDVAAELGVAIGVAVGVALVLAAVGCVCYRRRKATVQTATVVKQLPPAAETA